MLNMKKLIDQTDFDNLNQLTKRWANTQKPNSMTQIESSKQNNFKKSNEILSQVQLHQKQEECPQNVKVSQTKTSAHRKSKIVPQVIDQDTEHFKNKLEHLLNNFKTDAVAQFMNMKKEMLEYQQDCVKTDTQKYLTMYEQKHKQLLQTKQKLLEVSRESEKKTLQVELLSQHIAKLNERMRVFKYVSRPFSILYQNKVLQKQHKFKMKQASNFEKRKLKQKALSAWIGVYKLQRAEKQKINSQQRIQKQVSQIVGKFQKQMELMKYKLADVNRKNQEYENNKHLLQQNLKKAFLRGVCAMNMEAMGVLGNQNIQQNEWNSEKDIMKSQRQKSILGGNASCIEPKITSLGRQDVKQNLSMFVPNNNINSQYKNGNNIDKASQNVIIHCQKSQSKNHKWKQAPIVGIQQAKEVQQPRMQVVRPTNEGKVIKVVDGRSAIDQKKATQQKLPNPNAQSRKKF